MNDTYSRMGDSVKGICLHRSVVKHIFKDDIFTNFQLMVKFLEAHKVTTEATVSTYSIYILSLWSLHRIINL